MADIESISAGAVRALAKAIEQGVTAALQTDRVERAVAAAVRERTSAAAPPPSSVQPAHLTPVRRTFSEGGAEWEERAYLWPATNSLSWITTGTVPPEGALPLYAGRPEDVDERPEASPAPWYAPAFTRGGTPVWVLPSGNVITDGRVGSGSRRVGVRLAPDENPEDIVGATQDPADALDIYLDDRDLLRRVDPNGTAPPPHWQRLYVLADRKTEA